MSLARTPPLKRSPGPARKTPLRPSARRQKRTRAAGAGKAPTHASALQKPVRTRRKGWKQGIVELRKTEAKHRDFYRCQFPGCTVQGRDYTEAAHLVNSGSGGRMSVSSKRGDFVTLCNHLGPDDGHHRGRRSLHQQYIRVVPRNPELGADGHLDWYTRTRRGNIWSPWTHVGTTAPAVTTFALRS